TDALLDPLALVRESELRAAVGQALRDRPGDRAAVGDAEDEAALSVEGSRHARESNAGLCERSSLSRWRFGYAPLSCVAPSLSPHSARRSPPPSPRPRASCRSTGRSESAPCRGCKRERSG